MGACLTRAGTVELDALVMRGRDLELGAVAAARKVRNASELARHVMDSEHTMIVGEGTTLFAAEKGMEIIDESQLITEYEKKHLEELQNYTPAVKSIFGDQSGHDTVGAVALDCKGNFAACTFMVSTSLHLQNFNYC